MPKPAHFNNNKSTITHSNFVSEAIQDLLKTNRIIEVDDLPHLVDPLSVTVQNSGKKRLILDLRYVNKHIYKERTKFDYIILTFINQIKNSLVFHGRLGGKLVILYLLSTRLD